MPQAVTPPFGQTEAAYRLMTQKARNKGQTTENTARRGTELTDIHNYGRFELEQNDLTRITLTATTCFSFQKTSFPRNVLLDPKSAL